MNINKKILASGVSLTLLFCIGGSSLAATGTVNTETVRMRETASTESNIILNLDQNSTVEILGEDGEWYQVKSGESTGYIHKNYLDVSEDVDDVLNVQEESYEDSSEEVKAEENVEETPVAEVQEEKKVQVIGNKLNADSNLYLLPTFSSSKTGSAVKDTEVKIIKILNNWTKVEVDGKEGWIQNQKLVEMENVDEPTPEVEEENTEEETTEEENSKITINQNGYVNTESANLRSGPGTSYSSIAGLVQYETLLVISEENDWYEVRTTDNMNGYVSKPLVTIGQPVTSRSYVDRKRIAEEKAAQEAAAAQQAAQVAQAAAPAAANNGSVVATAQQYVGYSYVYGGSSPSTGFDCSGFTSYVYASCGKSISRTSYSQAYDGVAVDRANLQAGDLLLFNNGGGGSIGHVGIYVGDGQFIHASNPTGGVKYDTINSGYYATYYAGARRIY